MRDDPERLWQAFVRYVEPTSVIVEAGAHLGEDTVRLSELVPEGHVYSFEPVEAVYQQLSSRSKHLANVTTFQLALSGGIGRAGIFVSSGASDGSSSLLQPKEHLRYYPRITFEESAAVPTTTLDTWATQNTVIRVDALWLDLQGLELQVLQAATNVLEHVRVIHTEVNLRELYAGAALYQELREWLGERGFRPIEEDLPWEEGGNVVFARVGDEG
ncbi:MAG: FkbM family methyltransferase [Chloroflexota bacterium]